MRCLCLSLDKLIEVKRAAGRPKDLEAVAELIVIREVPEVAYAGHQATRLDRVGPFGRRAPLLASLVVSRL